MKKVLLLPFVISSWIASFSLAFALPQISTPNDIHDDREAAYAFINANITVDPETQFDKATMLIKLGKVVAVGTEIKVPEGYVVVDMSGRHIYPGFIDAYTHYGLPKPAPRAPFNFNSPEVMDSQVPGAYGSNDAIRAYYAASQEFKANEKSGKLLRNLGFGAVLTFQKDGIARGTSALVTLGKNSENELMLEPSVAAHYSLEKGSSKQSFPFSSMGSSALLRQTFMDADWYSQFKIKPFADQSLTAWTQNQALPQIFEVGSWQELLQAQKIADEFDVNYIYKGSGDEYQRLAAIKQTGSSLIIPLAFPEAMDVSDPLEAKNVKLKDMKHWELAPSNPAALASKNINFSLTAYGQEKDFWKNLRKAIKYGLSEQDALKALTLTPAKLLEVDNRLGHLRKGAIANFLITSEKLFDKENVIYQNWIQGERYELVPMEVDYAGRYQLTLGEGEQANTDYHLKISGMGKKLKAKILPVSDKKIVEVDANSEQKKKQENNSGTKDESSSKKKDEGIDAKIKLINNQWVISFSPDKKGPAIRLKGWVEGKQFEGRGQLGNGQWVNWKASPIVAEADVDKKKEEKKDKPLELGPVTYPFEAYGQTEPPEAEDLLIQNTTVWTLEKEGILINTDVLIRKGKIVSVGKKLKAGKARVIDGSNKHLTPGIVDEHSHIALRAVNDVAVNSGMVRMSDVVDSEDINIYRNLAGGVTSAQLLHGSANPIGGQSALVKMRWGKTPGQMLIENADGFIKFALGENVKRSSNSRSVRFPQTRMGVEQTYVDWFTRAQDYQKQRQAFNKLSKRKQAKTTKPRQDLVLDTMVEIINSRRFVTSHSYVQSEINMLMHVAEQFNFHINTFTHILEGYKVADKMARHGAGGSTFADWWAYKWEVRYAIPYNSTLMTEAGVTVAINSDDREMSRRLNQEAAKSVKYGGMDEIEALKLVTLNPAKLLHLDDRMGSIVEGKDADLVLWSDHPLSIYAKAEKTLVDGIVYFDTEKDKTLYQGITEERHRLIQKIIKEKPEGRKSKGRSSKPAVEWHCDSLHGYEYLLSQIENDSYSDQQALVQQELSQQKITQQSGAQL